MSPPPGTATSIRRTGRIIAAAVGLISLGVVIAMFGRGGGRQVVTGRIDPDEPAPDLDRDLADAAGQGLRVQIKDRHDPSRVAGEWITQALDPLPNRQYAVDRPEAWFYLRNGRTVYIRADSGRFSMPDRSAAPEEGELIGRVVARIYQTPPPGQTLDLDRDEPLLVAATDRLGFITNRGEFWTNSTLRASTRDVQFVGADVRVVFNQLRERLEFLRVLGGGSIRFAGSPGSDVPDPSPTMTDASDQTDAAGPAAGEPIPGTQSASDSGLASSDQTAPTPTNTREPIQTLYDAVFGPDVVVTQRQRVLKSDQLRVWARMVGNRLPPGAIFQPRSTRAEATPIAPPHAPTGDPIGAILSAAVAAQPEPPDGALPGQADPSAEPSTSSSAEPMLTPRTEDDVTLEWSGTLIAKPIESGTPPELAVEHVAMRFTAPQTGQVTMRDEASGAEAECEQLDYGASSGSLVLSGSGPTSVRVAIEEKATIQAGRIEHSLSTGVGRIVGPGRASSLGDGDEQRRIVWTDQADFTLAPGDGDSAGALEMAAFSGSVLATAGDSALAGDYLRTTFIRTETEASSLRHVHVEGNATGTISSTSSLAGDVMDILLEPPAPGAQNAEQGELNPTFVSVVGNVRGRHRNATVRAEYLEADLDRDEKGDVVATRATLLRNVDFQRSDGISASTDELRTQPLAKITELIGEGSTVSRGPTTISGAQIRLDGLAQSIEVFGPGRLDHHDPGDTGEQVPGDLVATWTRQMRFDDLAGLVECDGDVVVLASPDAATRDTVQADRIRLELTPLDEIDSAVSQESANGLGGRRLRRALAWGAGQGAMPEARVTSERWIRDATVPGGLRRERLLELRGSRIIADEIAGTLNVPEAGLLVIDDQRDGDEGAGASEANASASPGLGGARGLSLFRWAGSMSLDRAKGLVTMERGVRLRHMNADGSDRTLLECEDLTATLRPEGSSDPLSPEEHGRLRSVIAQRAVWLQSAGRELIADRLEYDAVTRLVVASTLGANLVTIIDTERGAATSARVLRWDMGSDRIEILDPDPSAAPR